MDAAAMRQIVLLQPLQRRATGNVSSRATTINNNGHVFVSRISPQLRTSQNGKLDSTAPRVFRTAIFASFFRANFFGSTRRPDPDTWVFCHSVSTSCTVQVVNYTMEFGCIQTPACVALTGLKNVPKRFSTWKIQTTCPSHTPACWTQIGQRCRSSSIRSHNSQPSHPPTAVTTNPPRQLQQQHDDDDKSCVSFPDYDCWNRLAHHRALERSRRAGCFRGTMHCVMYADNDGVVV